MDLKFGLRILFKRPVFTAIVVLMLATGIGANTTIFSVLRATIARPLPYKEPDRLVWLANTNPSLGVTQTFLNPADILDYREQASSFEQIASWGTFPQNFLSANNPERLETIYVTTNFFETLGVEPALGRVFGNEDATESGDGVIISHSLWQRRFGSDPNVIGQKIKLGDSRGSAVIVGVMPAEFNFPPHVDLYSTYAFDRAETKRGGTHNDRTIARLARGVTIEQAQAEISRIARQQAEQYPDTNKGWGVLVTPFRDYLFGSATVALPMLMSAVFLVLLIASTNVASLQLARGVSRQKEIAVRLAVGAGRRRIVTQLLTESAMLAAAGGALGLLLGFASLRALRALGPATVPGLRDSQLDAQALWFTLLVSLLTALAFGLFPAIQSSKLDLTSALKEAGVSAINKRSRSPLRNTLVVAQIALALVLLVNAGLLIKSFWKLQSVSPGFQSEHILSAGVSLNLADYVKDRRIQFFKQALERVADLPGVEAAGAISHLPLGGRTLQARFRVEGDDSVRSSNDAPLADYRVVTPSLFQTLGIELRKGRLFTEHDTAKTARTIIVNEAFARTYLAGRDALDFRVEPFLSAERAGRIIGVVADVKHRSLEEEAVPTIYVSYLQESTFPIMNYVIRTRLEPELLSETVRRELQSIDPNQVVFNVRALPEFLSDSMAPRRFSMALVTIFALIAVCLAGAGIYGVMAFIVAERTHEMGIRLAIGARQKDLMMLVLGWGARMAVAGCATGLLAALAVTRVTRSLLYNTSATDPVTFAALALLMVTVALIACYFPARRAMKTDPLVALRCE